MPSLNKVFLIGNLTRDPDVRQLPSGMSVADLGLATTRKFRTQGGEDREETCFVKITVFGRQAETVGQYLRKGSPVMVEGRLKYEEWEKDGKKQSRLGVIAERVQFLSAPRRDADMGDAAQDHGGRRGPAVEREPPARGHEPAPDLDHGTHEDSDNLPF